MIDLQESRRKIDEIDTEILRLFEERMRIAEDVARYKLETGKKVLDRERELQKIADFREKAHGAFNQTAAQELLRQIMSISRKRQYQLLDEYGLERMQEFIQVSELPLENVHVVFQGVEGAYSYAAMKRFFPDSILGYHVKTWKDAMDEVSQEKADYAVIPIENSTAGIVSDIYDLLMDYRLFIVGEQEIRVDHVLLGLPGTRLEQIGTVHSHPQGLAQCKQFLETHPSWKSEPEINTAGSARKVRELGEPSHAAIASREAGELYGLDVLAENICRNEKNTTRFIIVSKKPLYEKDAKTVSICTELPHETGSLYHILSHIIFNGLNMTKIESRPIPGKTWEYRFFVDFDGNLADSAVRNALRGIFAEANRTRVLGNYRKRMQ